MNSIFHGLKNITRSFWSVFFVLAVVGGLVLTTCGGAMYRLEAEIAGPTKMFGKTYWEPRDVANASDGKVLYLGNSASPHFTESDGIGMPLTKAGIYHIWVRYIKTDGQACTFLVSVRDEDSEALVAYYCDFVSAKLAARPWEAPAKSKYGPGPVWERFEIIAERPIDARISFQPKYHGGGIGPQQVDCMVVTDDNSFDPSKLDVLEISKIPSPVLNVIAGSAPKGFVLSPPPWPHVNVFSSIKDSKDQFQLGLIHCGGVLADPAHAVRLGFNRDHTYWIPGLNKYGITCIYPIESYEGTTSTFAQDHPAPEGRFVNSDGETGAIWSHSYPPLKDEVSKLLREKIEKSKLYPGIIDGWRICVETGGYLDYSSYSQDAFRTWLRQKHGKIDILNSCWSSKYSDFNEITPPKKFVDNRACWFEFRDFCGGKFTEVVSRQIPIIKELDSEHKEIFTQNSGLDLLSPYFTAMRPIDLEQYWTEGLKDQKYACWDTYAADDQIGCDIDLIRSLSGGKKPLSQEWSVHTRDPRIAARTFWNYVAKGSAGVYAFQFFGDSAYCEEWDKWSMARSDLTPRDKLGAFSDAAQEVHRLEPLLTRAEVTYAVKPVALYYSRLDLSVAEPFLSMYGQDIDNPLHVYATLRGRGYVVRWITPKQIEAGQLSQIGALVMVGCKYVPAAAAAKIEEWVGGGGNVIGDSFPGAYNEYAQPQDTLAKVFGIRPKERKTTGSKLAVQQSSQGYGEVTTAAVDGKSLAETTGEIFPQWDSMHPVAVAMGDFFLSGMGLERIECTAGEVIGMSYYSTPGITINNYGNGHAMYSAMMLGTMYDASATAYEFDSSRSGMSFGRLLDTFLKYSGVSPASVITLNDRIRAKVRVEAPMVTKEGNVLVGLMSYNDVPVDPFPLEVELPQNARDFRVVIVAVGGSRRIIPVDAKVDGTRLKLTMPEFDTHAMIMAIKTGGPVVGLEITGVPRGAAGLLTVKPGVQLTVKATVYNPSENKLPKQKLELILPRGWAQSEVFIEVPAVSAYGNLTVMFKVRPPQINGGLRLRPLLARYGESLATEMVWWTE